MHNDFSHDITDPVERRKSRVFMHLFDHEFLRVFWHNFAEVAPGVYRSNHPTRARFEAYAAKGIKTVLNLRGAAPRAYYHFEVEACADLGMTLIDIPLSARRAPGKRRLLETLDILGTIQKPFLMHCKSGADRTGLVAALYLMEVEGRSLAEARRQLSLRFIHLTVTQTGVLDYVLWRYAERLKTSDLTFREWVRTEYDGKQIQADFDATGFRERLAF